MRARKSDQDGGSLVELMIGVFIVVPALPLIVSAVIKQTRQRQLDGEIELAMVACRNTIEDLRGISFDDLPAMDAADFDVPGPDGQAGGLHAVTGDPDGLPGEISVTLDSTFAGVNLYAVRTTVTWTGVQGRQEMMVKSLLASRRIR